MKQPTVNGRKLPRNDWEGTGLAAFKTCMDHSAGRAVAFATNGRIDLDGAVYRHSIHPHAPAGITLQVARREVLAVAHLPLVIPSPRWGITKIRAHLRKAQGLIVTGWYDALSAEYRYQSKAHFTHAVWASHISAATGNWRVWDALDRDEGGYGRWIPDAEMARFVASLGYQTGYVPLQPL
jgi:hypothetical protein